MDVVLDASSPYYPYKTYLLSGVSLSWLLFKALFYDLPCLFHLIVRPEVKYLLILNIDLHERQTSRLRQFHVLEPLFLVSLAFIRSVSHTEFYVVDRFGERYGETMRLQYERNQRHLFARILEAEEEYQRRTYGNDFDHIWNQLTSASPHFIADFRLKTPLHVNGALLHERCSICLTKHVPIMSTSG